jgi:hypothetical protein
MRSSSRVDQQGGSDALPLPVRALRLTPVEWLDLIVATFELAIARVRLATADRSALLAQPETPRSSRTNTADSERVQRVRLAIARTSHRVPWRADCLVQALAAQRWLRRLDVETALFVGVPGKPVSQFEAHAWLMHDDDVITGGQVDGYVPLSSPTRRANRGQSRTG